MRGSACYVVKITSEHYQLAVTFSPWIPGGPVSPFGPGAPAGPALPGGPEFPGAPRSPYKVNTSGCESRKQNFSNYWQVQNTNL